MEAVPYRPCHREAWNLFNAGARNGHFMFDRGYMEYHADRFTDASLVILRGGDVVGALPANRDRDTVSSHAGLSFGGLITGDESSLSVMEMLDLVCARLQEAGCRHLVYKPLPRIYHRRPAEADLYWLHQRGARLLSRDISTTIDLGSPGAVASRRRRGMRKAERAGVRFIARSQRWSEFWAILTEILASRHDTRPPHALDEITALAAGFRQHIVLHTAELDGELLAGVVMFDTPCTAHAQYIAASPRGRETGALDGLFQELLSVYRARRYFSFGISNDRRKPPGGSEYAINAGLITQKEEFGGGATVNEVYRLPL